MPSSIKLNESTIKSALDEGLITPNEAEHMLRVYLHKFSFKQVSIKQKNSPYSSRLHK